MTKKLKYFFSPITHTHTHTQLLARIYSEMGEHLAKHGDGVKDVAFSVEDVDAIFKVSLMMNSLHYCF